MDRDPDELWEEWEARRAARMPTPAEREDAALRRWYGAPDEPTTEDEDPQDR